MDSESDLAYPCLSVPYTFSKLLQYKLVLGGGGFSKSILGG